MELELESERHQGAHEVGGAPPPLWTVSVPSGWFFHQYYLFIPKTFSVKFQVIPRTFISAQKQHQGNSAKNNVSAG